MSRLEGKRAIITGAASGIGRATATLFAEHGACVVCADVNEAGVNETAETINAAGGKAIAVKASSSDEAETKALIARCLETFGGLEIFYANAGISGGMTSLFETEVDDWKQVLEVNVIGVFLGIKHAALHMREHGGGSILCTASVAGLRSGAGPVPYSASKAGVINMVQTCSQQLAGTGVRVNAICPGLIETGMTKPMFDMAKAAGKEKKIGQLNPLLRAGAPHEIAGAALFLASDESSYVNGQAYAVDGGLSGSLPTAPGRFF
ncbi:MAG: NAD(P)-dependent dehydrogenase (short-subunit alcohol dehydrogenase family) [Myxococcota bacterium]|jgi:NAD(P)-dependent dehydrogenase (short-subunit alcohol dehydrogenase family)